MEQPSGSANTNGAARRNEDIALDLLKFVASTTGIARNAPSSTGFTAPTASKADDQISQLLDLYGRCLRAIEGKSGR